MNNMQSANEHFGPIDSSQMISEKKPRNHHTRMIFITVLVLLVALGGYIVLSRDDLKFKLQKALRLIPSVPTEAENDQKLPAMKLSSSVIQDRTASWIEARTAKTSVALGEKIEVTIVGASNGKDITGYDTLVAFDPEVFTVESVKSLLPDFQIFHFDRGAYQAITGIKGIQNKDATVFDETPLVSLVLVPKQKGQQIITVLSENDRERTQFVDRDVQPQYPQVGSLIITVN